MGLYAFGTLHSVTDGLIYLSGRHTVATVCLPYELIKGRDFKIFKLLLAEAAHSGLGGCKSHR